MRVAIAVLALLLNLPAPGQAAGLDYTGVRLAGIAFNPIEGGEALRISFRTKLTFSEHSGGGVGLFTCRPHARFPASVCPGARGVFTMTFGHRDVIGSVSTVAVHVAFDDGGSCDFAGVTPLPIPSNQLGVVSPIVGFAGSYTCRDAAGIATKAGDFSTIGGPPLPVPLCKGADTLLCRTV